MIGLGSDKNYKNCLGECFHLLLAGDLFRSIRAEPETCRAPPRFGGELCYLWNQGAWHKDLFIFGKHHLNVDVMITDHHRHDEHSSVQGVGFQQHWGGPQGHYLQFCPLQHAPRPRGKYNNLIQNKSTRRTRS